MQINSKSRHGGIPTHGSTLRSSLRGPPLVHRGHRLYMYTINTYIRTTRIYNFNTLLFNSQVIMSVLPAYLRWQLPALRSKCISYYTYSCLLCRSHIIHSSSRGPTSVQQSKYISYVLLPFVSLAYHRTQQSWSHLSTAVVLSAVGRQTTITAHGTPHSTGCGTASKWDIWGNIGF